MSNRLAYFQNHKDHDRFLWFRQNNYLPDLYALLDDGEFALLLDFLDDTYEKNLIGECSISMMSEMLGFVNGSGLDAIVQCGHYAGWSSLLFGFTLRRMNKPYSFFSIDIDPKMTAYAQEWINIADLNNYVKLVTADSCNLALPPQAKSWLQQDPKMVFIDSSHQREQTYREMKLWIAQLQMGGLIFLHDASLFAQSYDYTHQGGVHQAIEDYMNLHAFEGMMINANVTDEISLVRQDGCGMGIFQKCLPE